MRYKNVIWDNGTECEFPDIKDHDYYGDMFRYLSKSMDDFDEYLFILYGHNGTKLPISRTFWHPKKVLLWLQGENKQHRILDIQNDYLAIFTEYFQDVDSTKIFNIPLGHTTHGVLPVPMNERLYNVSFVGCLNNNRVLMASELTGVSVPKIAFGLKYAKTATLSMLSRIAMMRNPGCYFRFNPDFNDGLDRDKYLYILSHTKVSLCPRGWTNTESFRYFESMKLGCAIITEQHPDRRFFTNAPVYQISDWGHVRQLYQEILTKVDLKLESERVLSFYGQRASYESTASYIRILLHSNFLTV